MLVDSRDDESGRSALHDTNHWASIAHTLLFRGHLVRALHKNLIRQSHEVAALQERLQEEQTRLGAVEEELALIRQEASTQRGALVQRVLDMAQGTGALLALLALIAYGAVRIANGAFYARLGVTPEEVGLSYAVILSRAIGSLILLLVSITLMSTAILSTEEDDSTPWQIFLRILFFLLGVIVLRALIPSQLFHGLVVAVIFFLSVLAVRRHRSSDSSPSQEGSPATNVPGSNDSAQEHSETRTQVNHGLLQRSTQAWWIAVIVILTFSFAATLGYQSARPVLEGEPVDCTCVAVFGVATLGFPWLSGSAGFLGIQTEEGRLEWIDGKKPGAPELPGSDSMVYLGANNGMIVVYDAENQQSLRYPVEAVKVTIKPRKAILFLRLEDN